MARKEGTITKSFRFEGKRYYVTGKTDAEVNGKMALKKRDLEEQVKIISKEMTVQEWCEEWMDVYKQGISKRGLKDIHTMFSKNVYPSIGTMKMKNVQEIHLKSILDGCACHSESYVHKMHTYIKECFKRAKINRVVIENPAENLAKPQGRKPEKRRSLTEAERALLLKVCENHRAGLFCSIMLYAGLRPGEVSALQWMDIHDGYIHVSKAVKSDGEIKNEPKTASGFREVPICSELQSILDGVEEKNPFGFVCTQMDGVSHHTKTSTRKMWVNLIREMNIEAGCRVFRNKLVPPYPVAEDLVMYDLRHTFCTDLEASGVPINVARYLMGHSDISVTSKIYTHTNTKTLENARALMDAKNAQEKKLKMEA